MRIIDTSYEDLRRSRHYAGNGSQSNDARILLAKLLKFLDGHFELRGKRVELGQFEVEFSFPEFVHGSHASEFQGVVFVRFAFDVGPSPSIFVGRADEGFESEADREIIDPSGGSAGFHDNKIDFVLFEDSGEVIPIGCGVEKRVFPSFGVEKAAHGIEPMPQRIGLFDKAGTCDTYELRLDKKLKDLIGLLIVDWGKGERAWVQYADRQDKSVLEIRLSTSEPPFPGHLNFIEPLSRIGKLPNGWIESLKSTRGIYVLTCPRTKEQYIGSATGSDGFHGRWLQYFINNHGGNKGLKSREPSDYQVSILEIAGSAQTHDEILAMEGRWQRKLRSREMGLNRNIAKKV